MSKVITRTIPPVIDLALNGSRFVADHLYPESCVISYRANRVAEARLVLTARDFSLVKLEKWTAEAARLKPGMVMSLATQDGSQSLFDGVIAKQDVEISRDHARVELVLRHAMQKLGATYRSQLFEQQSDGDIVRALLQAHGVKFKAFTGMTQVHAQMVQYACSDLQFLRARLQASNMWWLCEPASVRLFAPKVAAAPDLVLDAQPSPGNVLAELAQWRFDVVDQPGTLELDCWDVAQQAMRSDRAESAPLGQGVFDGAQQFLSKQAWRAACSVPFASQESRTLAAAQLNGHRLRGVQAKFTVIGSTRYALGQTLEIKGFGSGLDGRALVSEVRHELSMGRWITLLGVGQDDGGEIHGAALPRIAGLHSGTVLAYRDDPDAQERLRVHIPVLDLKQAGVWARHALPYASKDSGLCLYPEVGDEVVLGFMEGDPRFPVVLGAVHNPRQPSPYPVKAAGNHVKGLVLNKDGKKYYWLLDADKGEVQVGKEQDRLHFNADGVMLSSTSTLASEAQAWKAKAEDSLEMEAGTRAQLTSKAIDLKN